MLTATGFVNGRWQFSTPHRIHTPWPITKKFVASDFVGDPYGCAKFGANPSSGGFWANGWNITKNLFIYLFIPFFHQLTYRSDPSTDFHAWWLKRRWFMQGCAFGCFVDIASHFGGEIPPKTPIYGAWIGVFKPKGEKYWKFHVIETNASISTKFCTTIETINNSSRVVPIGAQQIQDGGRPPFKKNPLNRYISATVWPILIRSGTVTHIGLLQRTYR